MSHRDTILRKLAELRRPICDDCLSAVTGIVPRQTIFATCSTLATEGRITRQRLEDCHRCAKSKICSSPDHLTHSAIVLSHASDNSTSLPPSPLHPTVQVPDSSRPWHWEGNIQCALVAHLQCEGWIIRSWANTATKAAGKDIVAARSNQELWISVKGYPSGTLKTSAPTQARHWFSHAVFDACTYRDQSDSAHIALAFPDTFKTYHALAKRITWLRRSMPMSIYWLAQDGSTRRE